MMVYLIAVVIVWLMLAAVDYSHADPARAATFWQSLLTPVVWLSVALPAVIFWPIFNRLFDKKESSS
jgi:hypothetical protein